MKQTNILAIAFLSLLTGLAGACSSNTTSPNTTTAAADTNRPAANMNAASPANTTTAPKTEEDAPAAVKAVFPDAQSFTKQHQDIPKDAVADIEKNTGAKVPDTDHHSYLAFSMTGGARKQIGAATVVTAAGKQMVIIYDNKNGSPVIKEIRADGCFGCPRRAQCRVGSRKL